MRKVSENEMRQVNGGAHCTVCHYYYKGAASKYTWSSLNSMAYSLHVLSSSHKKALKAVGYGHNCCSLAGK